MNAYPDWCTLREIDTSAGRSKGSAFRAFKREVVNWCEGRDFVVLDHEQAGDTITRLRQSERIYASSVNVILLSPAAAQTLAARLATASAPLR